MHSRISSLALLPFFSLALLAWPACSSTVSVSSVQTKCGAVTLTGKSVACGTCVDNSCCAEATTCGKNADCGPLVACATACSDSDEACSKNCTAQHPNGQTDALAMIQCAQSCAACSSTAATTADGGGGGGGGLGLGGNKDSGGGGTGQDCATCLTTQCANEVNACRQDMACQNAADCSDMCATDACSQSCVINSNDQAAASLFSCLDKMCTSCLKGGGTPTGGTDSGAGGQMCYDVPAGSTDCNGDAAHPHLHDCNPGPPAGLNCVNAPSGPGDGLYCCDK